MIAEKLRRWEPYIYLLVIVLAAVSVGILTGFIIHQNHQIKATARQAAVVARAIQTNRIETIRRNCEDQNLRHGNAVRALYELLTKSGVKASRRKQAADPIIGLISALAPKQDCSELVRRAAPIVH